MTAIRKNSGPLILSAFVALAAIGVFGCNSSPSKNEITATNEYGLEGVLVKDANLSNIRTAVELNRNDSILSTASLLFGSDSLLFNRSLGLFDPAYSGQVSPDTAYPAGDFSLTMIDAGKFGDTLSVAVGGSFSAVVLAPANQQWRPVDGLVIIDWTGGSAMAEGYIMAAVKSNLAYTGVGYSIYATDQATAGSMRPDTAFYIDGGATVDTGMYYIYVYAYNGSPDKVLADQLLPVPIPYQRPQSINEKKIKGHFGSIVVTAFDSLHVVLQ